MLQQPSGCVQARFDVKFSHPIRVARAAILGLALSVGLAACSSSGEEDTFVSRDVSVLYNFGYENLENKRWSTAAQVFDEVERQHPYSVWARRAQLMAAYAYYMDNDYENAILSAERFLALHPGNKDASYAHYLIAISHYEQITDVHRDQKTTEDAKQALTEVTRRFPGTEYARDAKVKLDLVNDQLAAKDMQVGRFYMDQGHYLAAVMRFKNVIDEFQTTSHTPEALHRLVEAYTALGVAKEARRYAAVLGHNHPGSKWYDYSYAMVMDGEVAPDQEDEDDEDRSFFARVFSFLGG